MNTAASLATLSAALRNAIRVVADENEADTGVSSQSVAAELRLHRAVRYLARRALRLKTLQVAGEWSAAADRSASLTTSRQYMDLADHLRDEAELLRGAGRRGDHGVFKRVQQTLAQSGY
jgi:hypothetical protein